MRKLMVVVTVFVMMGISYAQLKHYLVKQWYKDGNQMCEYDNGTVLNMGYKICPLSIEDPK